MSFGSRKKAVPFRAFATGMTYYIWKKVVRCIQTLHYCSSTEFPMDFLLAENIHLCMAAELDVLI